MKNVGRFSQKPAEPCPRCYAPMTGELCMSKGCMMTRSPAWRLAPGGTQVPVRNLPKELR